MFLYFGFFVRKAHSVTEVTRSQKMAYIFIQSSIFPFILAYAILNKHHNIAQMSNHSFHFRNNLYAHCQSINQVTEIPNELQNVHIKFIYRTIVWYLPMRPTLCDQKVKSARIRSLLSHDLWIFSAKLALGDAHWLGHVKYRTSLWWDDDHC